MALLSEDVTDLNKGRGIIEAEMEQDKENFIIYISFYKISCCR